MEHIRREVEQAGELVTIDIQTRVAPAASVHHADLVVRLRPPAPGERRPNILGLEDLSLFLGELPFLLNIAGARHVRVVGGAHLSVGCALGAALPSTVTGRVDVVDQTGDVWTLDGQAPRPVGDGRLVQRVAPPAYNRKRGPVAVYVDLLPETSNAAVEDFFDEQGEKFAGVLRLRSASPGALIDAATAAAVVGEIASELRSFADELRTTEVHLLLRCPYALAVLVGRTLNTLTVHMYEWETGPGPGEPDTARYLPSLVLRSGVGGSPVHAVTAPPSALSEEEPNGDTAPAVQ